MEENEMKKKPILILGFFLVVSFFVSASKADLIAHWEFEEGYGSTTNDSVGNNHGTLNGDTSWVTGKVGNYALHFDGDGDYVDVGTMGDFGNSIDEVSISALVKSNVTDKTMSVLGAVNIFSSGPGRTQVRVDLNYNAAGYTAPGYIALFVRDENGRRLSGSVNLDTGVTDDNWHHLIVVFRKSSNTINMYLDGIEQTVTYRRTESPVDFANFDRSMYIGACHASAGAIFPFNGSIDDVRIYDHAIPEPATVLLLGLGAMLLQRKRN
jgi:hypothetical protein